MSRIIPGVDAGTPIDPFQSRRQPHPPRASHRGPRMRILVTGGTGYIGCHTCLVLLERGHHVAIADNLSNSSPEVVERLQRLSGTSIALHRVDVRDEFAMFQLLKAGGFDAVVHFAALKAVGESTSKPLAYYTNNIGGLLTLARVMSERGCKTLVFSSSATVYGTP
ncbi:MAG: SDR family NAD(P)-dependent oxidoreductase, partial [Lysobacter sp.]|nr:SDR family NAD(P)-dependent oxidoreductase [Lysobacter sp.]